MEVTTEAGTWHVRRRWAPRRLGRQTLWHRFTDRMRRVRKGTVDRADGGVDGCAFDIGEGILILLVAIVVIVFLIFVGIPFLVALGELLFLVLLTVAGVFGRVVFRRPWTIDAAGPSQLHHEWRLVGWRRSGAAKRFVAEHLAAHGLIPTTAEVDAAVLVV